MFFVAVPISTQSHTTAKNRGGRPRHGISPSLFSRYFEPQPRNDHSGALLHVFHKHKFLKRNRHFSHLGPTDVGSPSMSNTRKDGINIEIFSRFCSTILFVSCNVFMKRAFNINRINYIYHVTIPVRTSLTRGPTLFIFLFRIFL